MSERAIRFGQWQSLAGVVTEPANGNERKDAPTVLFLNAGLLHHIGPHRLYVHLARRWRQHGVRSLRFDVSGCGDSGLRQDRVGRHDSLVHETKEAMDFMASSYDSKSFVLFGICTGADQALRTALDDPRVKGAILLDGYSYVTFGSVVRYYASRVTRLATWWNVVSRQHPRFTRNPATAPVSKAEAAAPLGLYNLPPRDEAEALIRSLIQRKCQLCFVFTHSHRFSHRKQFGEMFPSVASDTCVHVELIKNTDHVFTPISRQEALMEAADRWMRQAVLGG